MSSALAHGRGPAERVRALGRWLGPSGAVFVVVCVAAQFAPLANVLGYEFGVALSLLVSAVGSARVLARSDTFAPWRTAASAALDLLAMVGIGAAISLANMVRVVNCEPGTGLLYALILGVGAIPMAVATGLVLRAALPGREAYAALAALVLASVAATLAWLALQPSIVAWSTIAGYFAGSIYDESLVDVAPHVTFRLWNLACAVALVGLIAWHRSRGSRDARVAVAALLIAVTAWAWRGDLGWERSRAWVADDLGGFAQTEHFDVYYDAAHYDERRLALLLWDHEARYAELTAFLGTAPAGRLRSFVYGTAVRKGELMGGRRTLVAKIWLGEMHIVWDGPGDGMLGHEMAHLVLRDAGRGPLRLASADGLLPIMALVEGAAGAAAWDADHLDEHAWSAAMVAMGVDVPIADLLGPTGFWSQNSDRAYTLVSSFARWLVETRGADAFVAAYRAGGFEAAYGVPLAELVAGWRAWLGAEYALPDEVLAIAQWRFDRPSLLGRRCGRALATRFDRGRELASRRENDEARRCYLSIVDDDPNNMAYRLGVARALRTLGFPDDAVALATHVRDADGAGRAAQLEAIEFLADGAWLGGRHDEALDAYRSALDESVLPADRRRLQAKVAGIVARATAPLSAEAIRTALVEPRAPSTAAVVALLLRAAHEEGTPLATYLAALRVSGDASPIAADLLAGLDRTLLTTEQAQNAERALAYTATLYGDRDAGCAAWSRLAQEAPRGSGLAAEAALWAGRCARGDLPGW